MRGYDSTSLTQDSKIQTDLLRDLFLTKQALVAEMKNYNNADPLTPGIPVCNFHYSKNVLKNSILLGALFNSNRRMVGNFFDFLKELFD